MIPDIIKYTVSNIKERKLRSFLTVLSILIGITAIFALISFGQGIQSYIVEMAKEQGTDKLIMMPRGFSAPGTSNIVFTDDDLDFINRINGVDLATGMTASTGKISFKDYPDKYVYVFGFSTEPEEIRLTEELAAIKIEKGRGLKKGDVLKAVLGYNYQIPDKLFKKAISVGDKIEINDIPVEVIGFYEEVGNPSDDSQVYLSKEGAKEIFGVETYEYIYLRSSVGQNPSELATKINEKFRKHRNQKEGEEDFFVQTFEDALKTFTSIIAILNGILLLIAFISIVVAAVNIANTMYTSVLERTREIGVMKAIGAKNKFILWIFVTEAGLLGFIGGVIGVLFGYGVSRLGEFIAASAGLSMLRPAFPIWLTIGCIVFATLVGAGSGLLPSIQASKLSPVDALRYE